MQQRLLHDVFLALGAANGPSLLAILYRDGLWTSFLISYLWSAGRQARH